MNRPELLAPAGNLDTFKAAIQAGADAIYCSGKQFGARAFAENFSNDELIEASFYAHLRNKRLYVTVNTIIFEEELPTLKEYLAFLYQYVDGVIVQDLGVMHYIRKNYPDFPVHISTQMNIHNLADSKFLASLGVKRIVLARETPLEVIKAIIEAGIEVEVFVHGALCFAYSGNCYFSKEIGGRSGNRGTCAQPCRKTYSLYEDNHLIAGHQSLLSMKDLFTLQDIFKLCDLNIASFKIEGRMKNKTYVTEVVKAYKEAIDKWFNHQVYQSSKEVVDNLQVTFNREYTNGYILGAVNNSVVNLKAVNHQGIKIGTVIKSTPHTATIKLTNSLFISDAIRFCGRDEWGMVVTKMLVNDKWGDSATGDELVTINTGRLIEKGAVVLKTKSKKLEDDAKRLLSTESVINDLKLIITLFKNQIEVILIDDNLSNRENVVKKDVELTEILEISNVISLNHRMQEQFAKTNKLPINYTTVIFNNPSNLYVPIPIINEVRRSVLAVWQSRKEHNLLRYPIPYYIKKNKDTEKIHNGGVSILNRITQAYGTTNNNVDFLKNISSRIDFNYQNSNQKDLIDHLADLPLGGKISPYLNIANTWAIEFIRQFTSDTIYLSVELDEDHLMKLISKDPNLGILAYTKMPLMISNHCVVGNYYHKHDVTCLNCLRHHYQIEDEYQEKYDLILPGPAGNCQMVILNGHKRNFNQLKTVKRVLLEFYDESEDEMISIINRYQKSL